MLKKNPFLIFVVVLVVVVIGGFAYSVFSDRYFKKTSETPKELETINNSNSSSENKNAFAPDGSGSGDSLENGNENSLDNQNGNENRQASDISKIGPKDCENRCSNFEGADLDYCREICGLNKKNSNVSTGDCSDKSGLSKDYCLRDLGIEKRDFKFCDQILDAKIKKNCRDRITEDMLD